MDKIGGLDWFFPRANIILEAGGPIRCYSDSQIDTSFQSVDCDYIIYTSLNEFTNNNNITIYPNPTTYSLTISSKQAIEKIELFDMSGNYIRTTKKSIINLSNLEVGQYILIIYLTSGQKIEKKIVKNAN